MYLPRPSSEILRDLVARVVARTDLTDLAEGSVLTTLLRAVSEQIAESDIRLAKIRDQFTLEGATGVDLDERAEEIGLTRLTAATATGSLLVGRDGTTGALSIPAGSVFGRSDSDVTYISTANKTILAGTSSVVVSVKASVSGAQGNAPARSITTILDAPVDVTSVIQGTAITNGRDLENDVNLRARARDHIGSLSRTQPPAIRHAALSFQASDGTRATTATIYEPPNELGRCELLVDDGSGLGTNPPTQAGSVVSVIINAARGQVLAIDSPVVDSVRVVNGAVTLVENRDFVISRERGIITLLDAAPVAVGDTLTISDYSVYTGLLAELQALIEGDVSDISSGYRAAGIGLRVLPAPVQLVNIDILMVVNTGSTVTTIKTNVENAVSAFLSSREAGAPVFIAALLSVVMGVDGVQNASVFNANSSTKTPDLYPNSARHVLRAGSIRAVTSLTQG